MRAVIQRVSEASVMVDEKIMGVIKTGMLIFLGIEDADTAEDIEWLSNKIVNMRIFNDEHGVMNISLKDVNGEILLVSQFTLHASTKKGNRPSYIGGTVFDETAYASLRAALTEKGVEFPENRFQFYDRH